jgi:hypothetical protein
MRSPEATFFGTTGLTGSTVAETPTKVSSISPIFRNVTSGGSVSTSARRDRGSKRLRYAGGRNEDKSRLGL